MSSVSPYRTSNPLMNYLLVLIACVGSYLLYLKFVVPVVEVTAQIVPKYVSDPSDSPASDEETEHHRWFKTGDWELEPCAVLRTSQGRILFHDYSREDPKTWLVHPFTMVLDREPDQESGKPMPPIVLRCQTGARLHFSKPVTSVGGSSFQLEQAQLEGSVELYRRIKAFSAAEDLRIQTSNIQINDKEIISIDDVAFRFGNNQGVGRHLSMQLNHHGEANGISQDISRIKGITNIRLGILSSMMLKPKSQASTQADRLLSHDSAPIEITSAGPFEFDFNTNLARFVDNVQVRKMDPVGDSLMCDELILQFASGDGTRIVELDAATDQEFELENVVAAGKPALLNAKSQNAKIVGRTIHYNLKSQNIKVADPKQVEIIKDGDRFVSSSIEYSIDKDKRLGDLTATGPGRLTRSNGTKQFAANWSSGMTIRRLGKQQHLIAIQGAAQMKLDSESSLNAENINITIWEVPVYDQNHRFVRWSYQPAELNAKQNVHIASNQLIADSNLLQASWPKNPQAIHLGNEKIGHFKLQQPVYRQASLQQTIAAKNTVRRVNFQVAESKTPVFARGNLINIVVEDRDGKSDIKVMEMNGSVNVHKPSKKKPGNPEFQVTGDHLKMVPVGDQIFEIKVASNSEKPAQLTSDKLRLIGRNLFLNQALNTMWVSGQGRVKMNAGDSQSDRIDVSFLGGMIFDGLQIYFEHDVHANIEQVSGQNTSATQATGTALKITLDKQVSFRQLQNSDSDPVKSVNPTVTNMAFWQNLPKDKVKFRLASFNDSMPDPVVIQNQKLDSTGNILEKLVLHSPYAKMNEASNELTAFGPGSIQIYRKGNNGSSPTGFGFVGNRNSPNRDGLTYIHANFDNQLIANQATEEIVILGNLRSVYAPVENFDQVFDPDQPVNLPAGSVRLNCDRIDLLRSNNPLSLQSESQFIATGNAHIQSETIDSQADKISYRDNTDILTLQSTSGRDVLLKIRRDSQSQWNQQIAGSELVYRLKDNTANIRKVGSVSATIGNQP